MTARPSVPVQIVAVWPALWHGQPDLITVAPVRLERAGTVLAAAGQTRASKFTAASRLMLPPRGGPARERARRRRPVRAGSSRGRWPDARTRERRGLDVSQYIAESCTRLRTPAGPALSAAPCIGCVSGPASEMLFF